MGLHSADLGHKVSIKIGYQFNPQDFGQMTILDFVQNYVLTERAQTNDIEFGFVNPPPNFVLKSRSYAKYLWEKHQE